MKSPITKQCGSIYRKYVCVYVWCIDTYKTRNIYLTSLQFWVSLDACLLPSFLLLPHISGHRNIWRPHSFLSHCLFQSEGEGQLALGSRERAVGIRPGVKQHLWLLSHGWEWVFTVHLVPVNSHCMYRDGWVANKTRRLELQMGRAMPCHPRDAITEVKGPGCLGDGTAQPLRRDLIFNE